MKFEIDLYLVDPEEPVREPTFWDAVKFGAEIVWWGVVIAFIIPGFLLGLFWVLFFLWATS